MGVTPGMEQNFTNKQSQGDLISHSGVKKNELQMCEVSRKLMCQFSHLPGEIKKWLFLAEGSPCTHVVRVPAV